MKKAFIPVALLAMAVVAVAKNNADPVLLTVDGKDVPLSEFMYLYNKNTDSRQSKMSIDEYLDLFITYKLKVADAEACRLDTTASFKSEYNGYRSDLAKPYLNDKEMEDRMVAEAYSHRKREVDVSHIMVEKGRTPEERDSQMAFLDSLRSAILAGEDFAEVARKHSIDKSAVRNGGHMGWLVIDRVPYSFEKVAYGTSVGEISEVMETPFGYHIIRVEAEREAAGEVLAQHILKLTQGRSTDEAMAVKSAIDSIYASLVSQGDSVDFSDVARRESEDPGSAANGGMLPWFGRGRMVPEFENVAFSLQDGEISTPFKTSYGYHIIKRLDHRGVPELEQLRPAILKAMERDGRMAEIARQKRMRLRKAYNVETDDSAAKTLATFLLGCLNQDSSVINIKNVPDLKLGSINGEEINAKDLIEEDEFETGVSSRVDRFVSMLVARLIGEYIDNRLDELEIARIERENPEFRNLLREYHDGILLFDISSKRVWDASANDEAGLTEYFNNHSDKYAFDAPHYKGCIIYATTDSVLDDIKSYVRDNKPGIDALKEYVAGKYDKDVKVEKILAEKGKNRLVDAVMFDGDKPELKGRFKHYMLYGGSIIYRPEEMSDVRANVVSDYQAELERRWIDELKSKYRVKINKNQLKKLR